MLWSVPRPRNPGQGTNAKVTTSALVGVSHAMLSQNVLHRTQADRVPLGQLPLGRARTELADEALYVRVRQSASLRAWDTAPSDIGPFIVSPASLIDS